MSNPDTPFDFVCMQQASSKACTELYTEGAGKAHKRDVNPPGGYYALHARGLVRFFLWLKDLIRLFVRAIYLFPILLVAKITLWAMDLWYGDLITVAFVGLLVVFFALFSVFVLLYAFVGPPSKRQGVLRFELPTPEVLRDVAERWEENGLPASTPKEELARLANGDATSGNDVMRIRGKIHAGQPVDALAHVLVDTWEEGDDEQATRVFGGRTFAVVADGQPPVLVHIASPPWLLGDWRDSDSQADGVIQTVASWPSLTGDNTPPIRTGRSVALDHGDEVELIARGWEVVPNVDDTVISGRAFRLQEPGEEDGGPYRSADLNRGLMVTADVDGPVIVVSRPSG